MQLQVVPLNGYGERLLSLLEDASARKSGSAHQCVSMDKCEDEGEEDRKTLHSLCKKLSEDVSRKACLQTAVKFMYLHFKFSFESI